MVNFMRRPALQGRVMLAVTIQAEEVLGAVLDIGLMTQVSSFPNVGIVILMKSFDRAIALRVINGGKDQFRPDMQGQPNHLAPDVRMGRAPTETAFIIHLGVVGQAKLLPDMDQEFGGLLGPALSKGLTGGVTGEPINRIETGHPVTAREKMRHNIDLAELMGLARLQMGVAD